MGTSTSTPWASIVTKPPRISGFWGDLKKIVADTPKLKGAAKAAKEEAKKVAEEVVTALKEEAKVEVTVQVDPSAVKYAYSLIENNGQYHVISVEFDPNTLVSGKVKKIESNTEKFLMQEHQEMDDEEVLLLL